VAKGSKSKKGRKKSRKRSSGSGRISGMRSGIKGFVGAGPKRKESPLSRIITYILLAAAIALLIYRFTR
jgi:hypothetical protein